MKNAAYNIMPDTENILKTMGEQIKMARLRRKLSATLVAERAGISRSTLWKVENGNSFGCRRYLRRRFACAQQYG